MYVWVDCIGPQRPPLTPPTTVYHLTSIKSICDSMLVKKIVYMYIYMYIYIVQ